MTWKQTNEYIKALKKSRTNMLKKKGELERSIKRSSDFNYIQKATRKVEVLSIIRSEMKTLIDQL
jgi:hypothetical protein